MGVDLFADDLLTPLTDDERQTAECESSNIVPSIFLKRWLKKTRRVLSSSHRRPSTNATALESRMSLPPWDGR